MLTWQPTTMSTLITKRIGNQHRQLTTMTKENVEVRGVFFDWELTLARAVGDVTQEERLAALFQNEGLPYTAAQIKAGIQYSYDYYRTRFAHEMPRPQTQEEIVEHYRRILIYLRHRPISQPLLNRLYNGFALLPTFLYDDSLPTLRALTQMGIVVGVISNHTRQAREVMRQLIGSIVPSERIFISQEMGLHKPNSFIFSIALHTVDLAPEECLFVGDSLNADAVGAVQQGGFQMGLWLDREDVGASRPLPAGVARIQSLPEILDYI